MGRFWLLDRDLVRSVITVVGGAGVRAEWELDELIGAWTPVEDDWKLIGNKTGATRLGFTVLLKFYVIEGRSPAYPEEVPPATVEYVASLVKVDAALFAKYSWRGRTIEYHRAQIRTVFGTRAAIEADEEALARWLADNRRSFSHALRASRSLGWSGTSR
jgi:hypothetical protein